MVFRSADKASSCQLPQNRLVYCRELVRSPPKQPEGEYRACQELLDKASKLRGM